MLTTARIRVGKRAKSRVALALLGLLVSSAHLAAEDAKEVRTYSEDPHHLWNRLHQALFIRVGPDGEVYGHDRLDPLFWGATTHLLETPSHRKALDVLDEFQSRHGERMIRDPLQRAFLQHDLWTLFDWSATPATPWASRYLPEKRQLQIRLAAIIRRLALTNQDLAALPDNYARAVVTNAPAALPHGLFDRAGDWVHLSVNTGAAPSHMQSFGGRSSFQVLLRMQEGRAAALAYLERLRSFDQPWIYDDSRRADGMPIIMNPSLPQFPPGTTWALVRRMRLLDTNGSIRPTSIIQSIQLRRYLAVPPVATFTSREELVNAQQVFAFQASHAQGGALREVLKGERDFYQFQAHDTDPFELSAETLAWYRDRDPDPDPFRNRMRKDVLRDCFTCHAAAGVHSVLSLALITNDRRLSAPILSEADPDQVLLESVYGGSYQYGLLRGLWER